MESATLKEHKEDRFLRDATTYIFCNNDIESNKYHCYKRYNKSTYYYTVVDLKNIFFYENPYINTFISTNKTTFIQLKVGMVHDC